MTQTNPEQWARDVLHGVMTIWGTHGTNAAALAIQAAFAEREARLVGALELVGKILPSAAGLDDAPDSKIIACYMNMGELRAIKATLASLKDRTNG